MGGRERRLTARPVWIAEPGEARDEAFPVLAIPAHDLSERRALLVQLAAAWLGLPSREVDILHEDGQPPRLLRPQGRPAFLSSASRAGWAALAISDRPVGIDLERVEPGVEIPWRVLHPGEAAELAALPEDARPVAFARLWTAKEAYLKALGLGLSRDPASFRVTFLDKTEALVKDGRREGGGVLIESRRFPGEALVTTVAVIT